MPRIQMISDTADLPEERHEEFDAIVEVLHGVRGPFSVLLHSPGLAQKVMQAGAQIRLNSTLTPFQRELAVIAVSREKDAAYEWNAHVAAGKRAGMTDTTIDRVRSGGSVEGLPDEEQEIINYVRQLLRHNRVRKELFDKMADRHDLRWMVELTATIGQYQYISAINNAFEVEPPEGADPLPIPAPYFFEV